MPGSIKPELIKSPRLRAKQQGQRCPECGAKVVLPCFECQQERAVRLEKTLKRYGGGK